MQFSELSVLFQLLLLVGDLRKYLVYMQSFISTTLIGARQKYLVVCKL